MIKMKKLIISPWTRRLRNGLRNAKQFPYWKEFMPMLKNEDIHTCQVSITGEEAIGADEVKMDLSLDKLKDLLLEYDAFLAIDNFFPHFAHYYGKSGVVIWSVSDPLIFGYKENINLLKNRSYLRKDQFLFWEFEQYNKNAFVNHIEVFNAVKKKIGL
jgi:hypothetical protein